MWQTDTHTSVLNFSGAVLIWVCSSETVQVTAFNIMLTILHENNHSSVFPCQHRARCPYVSGNSHIWVSGVLPHLSHWMSSFLFSKTEGVCVCVCVCVCKWMLAYLFFLNVFKYACVVINTQPVWCCGQSEKISSQETRDLGSKSHLAMEIHWGVAMVNHSLNVS